MVILIFNLLYIYLDRSGKDANYILTSEPRCLRQMCSVKLTYNGTLSNRASGCLSFSLRTRGQPGKKISDIVILNIERLLFVEVGQLWIAEDQEQENTLQKIQLINKTLRIEHSLRSKIRNVIKYFSVLIFLYH